MNPRSRRNESEGVEDSSGCGSISLFHNTINEYARTHMINRKAYSRKLGTIALVVLVVALTSSPALADDHSYSTVVSHIKSNYNAKSQGLFGMVTLGRLLVKLIKPAGVKNFKMTMLRDVDYSRGPHPESRDFHAFVRESVDRNWQPLVQYAARKQKEWTYVYMQREKEDAKVLILMMHENQAFVVQFKFSPQRLSEFISDPQIMGISLKERSEEKH